MSSNVLLDNKLEQIPEEDVLGIYYMIVQLDKNSLNKWDDYVRSHPHGSFYYLSGWLKSLEIESGQKIFFLAVIDDDENIKGVLPLMETRGFPFGIGGVVADKRLSSLPRTPTGGPLCDDKLSEKKLIEEAFELRNEEPARKLQIKSTDENLNESYSDLTKVPWRDLYIYEIPEGTEEKIRFGNSKNHSAIKRAINKAIKNNVTARYADSLKDLKEWYALYLDTMRFHVTPARSYEFFETLWKNFSSNENVKLILAEKEENGKKVLIAGSLLFQFNQTIIYAFNGSNREDFELRPNDLLHWTAIKDGQSNGYKFYDFGETSQDNPGLAAYKSKWGTTKSKIYHYYYPTVNLNEEEEIDTSGSSGLKRKVWQLLSLPVTARIGKWVYKYL